MTIQQQEELKELLEYDSETGWFTWKVTRGSNALAGNRAGANAGNGYRHITIHRVHHYEHHLAWLYIHAEYPDEIDHINGVPNDNRITNLRLCTHTQNNFNMEFPVGQSGFKGVYPNKSGLKWRAQIGFGGKQIHLGTFDTREEAHEVYMEAYETLAGEFAYHNRPSEGI